MTEQPLQVSEIYNRLWGYEKPDIKPVLEDISKKVNVCRLLRKAYDIKMLDGSRYDFSIGYYDNMYKYELTNILNEERGTNQLYKFYKEGEEEELDDLDIRRNHQVRTYYALPYEKSTFEVGQRIKCGYDLSTMIYDTNHNNYYEITHKTKCFITIKIRNTTFRCKIEMGREGEQVCKYHELLHPTAGYAKNWTD
tara:strand:+ start:556 stop:1140 length:585 start_codon:yes stop_codon:yes gene_type:complete